MFLNIVVDQKKKLCFQKTLKAVSDSMINSTELTAEQVEQKRVLKGVVSLILFSLKFISYLI